ncbi:MAG TPA: type II toxin-antitoxin system RelE/ParE family toxin [Bryobacteraceae bacterium]|nr:type II toxin-antitoxin system RelE/ParE family toxin [Bryobacteraceae bacterium]
MIWQVEFTDEFETWWNTLDEPQQIKMDAAVRLLEAYGPDLPYPMSSGVSRSRHSHMRELRVQVRGRPFRVLYAFDPRRVAILLIGGDKTGDDRWYEVNIPIGDRLYDRHVEELKKEGKTEDTQDG